MKFLVQKYVGINMTLHQYFFYLNVYNYFYTIPVNLVTFFVTIFTTFNLQLYKAEHKHYDYETLTPNYCCDQPINSLRISDSSHNVQWKHNISQELIKVTKKCSHTLLLKATSMTNCLQFVLIFKNIIKGVFTFSASIHF